MSAPSFLTEQEFRKLKTLNSRVFKKIYDKYYGLIFHVVTRCGITNDDGLDIIHDTFLALYTNLDKIENPEGLKSWLVTTARNLAIDRIRKQRLADKHLESEKTYLTGYRCNNMISDTALHELELLLLGRLIDEIRHETDDDTLTLFYRHGLTAREISISRNEPLSTVTNRLSRLRARFKERIAKQIENLRASAY